MNALAFSSPQSTSSPGPASGAELDLLFGKTCPEPSAPTKGEILQQWLTHWQVWTEQPSPPKGWGTEGCAVGTEAMVEWSTLDAQWFGVAQRRRRVFALADFGDWTGRQPVLLEPKGLRGDAAPSREAGQNPAGSLTASAGRRGGVNDPERGQLVGTVATLDACFGRLQGASGQDANHGHSHLIPQTAHTLRGEGFDASEDGTGRGTPLVPIPFDTTQITSAANYSSLKPGDPCHPLAAGAHAPTIAFDCKASGQNGFGVGPVTSTLRSMGHAGSHQNGGQGVHRIHNRS